jgi:hypothetical protein
LSLCQKVLRQLPRLSRRGGWAQEDDPFAFLGLLDVVGGVGTGGRREGITACEKECEGLRFERSSFLELMEIAPVLESAINS